MAKPNPELFATHVLWYLSGIQAHLRELDGRIATCLAVVSQNAGEEFLVEMMKQSNKRRSELRGELFRDAMKRCGLNYNPQDMPPDLGGETQR